MQYVKRHLKDNLQIVPTHLSIDPIDGYSAHSFVPTGVDYVLSHAVHPTPFGDKQVASMIFPVIKKAYDTK